MSFETSQFASNDAQENFLVYTQHIKLLQWFNPLCPMDQPNTIFQNIKKTIWRLCFQCFKLFSNCCEFRQSIKIKQNIDLRWKHCNIRPIHLLKDDSNNRCSGKDTLYRFNFAGNLLIKILPRLYFAGCQSINVLRRLYFTDTKVWSNKFEEI